MIAYIGEPEDLKALEAESVPSKPTADDKPAAEEKPTAEEKLTAADSYSWDR